MKRYLQLIYNSLISDIPMSQSHFTQNITKTKPEERRMNTNEGIIFTDHYISIELHN